MKNSCILLFIYLLSSSVSCQNSKQKDLNKYSNNHLNSQIMDSVFTLPASIDEIILSEEQWKKQLNEESFYVMRQQGTERAFSGKYWNLHTHGIYICNACQLPLFSSEKKYESGTGWPSFSDPLRKDVVKVAQDDSHGMVRNEVLCARCKGHLGHVFDDGPQPTGLRYCMNSASLIFVPNGIVNKN